MSQVPNVLFNVGYAISDAEINKDLFINKKYIQERRFYSCKQENDFLKYVDKGISAGDVVGYTSNVEKTKGIFNQYGLLDEKQKKQLRYKLRNTQSNIWHCILSFTEAFGKEYMPDYETAQELLKNELPKFFAKAGFHKNNISWFAGLHENTDNQHIHLCFFEKEPLFRILNSDKLRFSRGKINLNSIEWFIVHIEKKLTNIDLSLAKFRTNIVNEEVKILEQGGSDYLLRKKFLDLYRMLPISQKISYQNLNMQELRPQIQDILFFIIKHNPELKKQYLEFTKTLLICDEEIKQICKRQKITDYSQYLVEEKYLEDLHRRLGNKIIQATLKIKIDENKEMAKVKKALSKKIIEKKYRAYLFKKSNQISKEIEEEATSIFEEYQYKLEMAEYKRLIEEGIIEA